MPESSSRSVPTPSPEMRRVAVESFERARQVFASGNHDYAIQLLLDCCKYDPGNLQYRQMLRKAQKEKYGNSLRGSPLAFLTTPRNKARVKAAKRSREYLKVLEYGELILSKNPWDLGTQTDMAEAFEALGLLDHAVFMLDQARQKYPKDPSLNRALARLFEKRGDFHRAILLWQLVREAVPTDVEASHKAKDLAASETIARGQYAESVGGSKSSPVLEKMETRAVEQQDKVGKDAAAIQKRLEADPTEPNLYLQLAGVYRKAGQEDRARAALTQGLGPTGNHFSLRLELAELDLDPVRKNLAAAESKLKALASRNGVGGDDHDEDETTAAELTTLRDKLSREVNSREIELFRMKADRMPGDASARFELGTRLLNADLLDEAITELQQARKDEKWKGRAALMLGHCFRKRNNWRLAQRNYEEALSLIPEQDEAARKEVLYQLAVGSAENGELQRALDLGHELANLDYGFKGIGKLIDDWSVRAGT